MRATLRLRERTGVMTYMDENARQLTDGVEAYLRRGLRVVLVAHSQGNLYAEVVTRELARGGVSTAHFPVVGIAVPNDRTVSAGLPGGAFLGHAFVDVYTYPGSAVSERVAAAVRQAIAQVARP